MGKTFLAEALERLEQKLCARCGYPRSEHHYNGACYGLCGEFIPDPEQKQEAGELSEQLRLLASEAENANAAGSFRCAPIALLRRAADRLDNYAAQRAGYPTTIPIPEHAEQELAAAPEKIAALPPSEEELVRKLRTQLSTLIKKLQAVGRELSATKSERAKAQQACEQMGSRIASLEQDRDSWKSRYELRVRIEHSEIRALKKERDALRAALKAYVDFDSAGERIRGLDECDRNARAVLAAYGEGGVDDAS